MNEDGSIKPIFNRKDSEIEFLLEKKEEIIHRNLTERIPMYQLAEEYGVKTKSISAVIRG